MTGERKVCRTRILRTAGVAALSVCGASASASASIAGFGNGAGFTATGYTQDNSGNIVDAVGPTISGGALTITTAAGSEARAAYYNTAQPIGSFVARFTFRNDPTGEPPLGAADGFAFVLQNDPRGLPSIGGGGAGLGYGLMNNNQPPAPAAPLTPVTPSAAVEYFLRNGTGATAYQTGGAIDAGSGTSTGSVDLIDGDPISVVLTYTGTVLTATLTDLSAPADTYTTSVPANIAAAVGGSTAYVGFTGGTGGGYSTQTISNFSFGAVPEPTALGVLAAATAGLLGRRRRRD